MTLRTQIAGSMVALVTPMQRDGQVDHGALRALVDWHIESGTDAIIAVGTTGESSTLDVAEHMAVVTAVVHQVAGRLPVIAGTGANATDEAITLTRLAHSVGADAALSVTPYYNKPPQEGLRRHYAAIAEACELPLILYNVPGRTGCDLLPETVGKLLDFPHVVGIKEAGGNQERMRALLELGRGVVVYSGDDATARESMLLGVRGDISVTANVAPAAMHKMCAAAMAGDAQEALRWDAPLGALHRDLFCQPSPIPVKWCLQQMGRIPSGLRLPLVPLGAEFEPRMRDALAEAGITLGEAAQ